MLKNHNVNLNVKRSLMNLELGLWVDVIKVYAQLLCGSADLYKVNNVCFGNDKSLPEKGDILKDCFSTEEQERGSTAQLMRSL